MLTHTECINVVLKLVDVQIGGLDELVRPLLKVAIIALDDHVPIGDPPEHCVGCVVRTARAEIRPAKWPCLPFRQIAKALEPLAKKLEPHVELG